MKIQTRGLNKGEQYACAPKDVKALFLDCCIYVSFGALGRDYRFDGRDYNHPGITGTVIASLGVNKRETINDQQGILSFYMIRDSEFGPDDRKAFVAECLPWLQMRYLKAITEDALLQSGVCKALVEWVSGNFRMHAYQYL